MSKAAWKKIQLAMKLEAHVVQDQVVKLGEHELSMLESKGGTLISGLQYDVAIKETPCCTCPDFQERARANKPYLAFKHIYYVFIRVPGLDTEMHRFTHQPVSKRRVKRPDLLYQGKEQICSIP